MLSDNKILLTGGSGLLGTELQKYIPHIIAPSHAQLDVTKIETLIRYEADIVIHAAAYTDVARAEEEKERCYKINTEGTANLAQVFHNAYFIYISSEYCYHPVNFYSYTKLWGEVMVEHFCHDYLVIRTLFKARPFPYKEAFIDQYTQGDYVDKIVPRIMNRILQHTTGIETVGTGRKTMFELARQTVPDIRGISVDDIKDVKLPKDYQ